MIRFAGIYGRSPGSEVHRTAIFTQMASAASQQAAPLDVFSPV